MGPGRGCRQLICYNCGGPGHYACDCTNLTRISCSYYAQFDHETIDCPTLITKMREKGVFQPPSTQNIQMMRSEPHKEELNVNMMLRSGMAMGEDTGKQPEKSTWVRKAPSKEPEFDLECAKEKFMEAKKSLAEASTSEINDQPEIGMDPSMLTTFLDTCMKLLCDNKAIKGLQVLITRCAGLGELRVVWKLGKNELCTGREMRLTTQIGEYEMDQVILDLGSVSVSLCSLHQVIKLLLHK